MKLSWLLPTSWRRKNRVPVVAVLRLAGVISPERGPLRSALNVAAIHEAVEQIEKIKRLSALALVINSPGGSPVQSALIHDRIRGLADKKNVPVYSFCEDVAASGGYWIACAGDEIHVNASSIVGSIGVISSGFGFTELMKKLGVERRLYTAGDNKSFLDPFSPEKDEDVTRLKDLQLELHGVFKAHVHERRGERLTATEAELMNGDFWTGAKAVSLGLADGIGELRSVLREKFGDKVDIRPIGEKRGRFLRRFGMDNTGGFDASPEAWFSAAEKRSVWSRYGL